MGGKGGAPVAEKLLEASELSEARSYESFSLAEQQDLYDRAAWDYLNHVNALSP